MYWKTNRQQTKKPAFEYWIITGKIHSALFPFESFVGVALFAGSRNMLFPEGIAVCALLPALGRGFKYAGIAAR